MPGLGKAFSYLIAAQAQAVSLILLAIYAGDWLNKNYPKSFNWYWVTVAIGTLGVAQTFYVVIRAALIQGKSKNDDVQDSNKTKNNDSDIG